MIELKFGSVGKRSNSTFVPLDTAFTFTTNAVLKAPCSDTKPVFTLNTNNAFPYNYCKWDDRYYWITDVVREQNNLITVSCTLDELATYKQNILATNAFVLYDETPNTEIVDRRLSTKTTVQYASADGTSAIFEAGQCIIVSIVSRGGGTGLYALELNQLSPLLNSINSWLDNANMLPIPSVGSIADIDDAAETLVHNITVGLRQLIATGKASDCIKSAILLPVDKSKFAGTDGTPIYLGDYDTGITGRKLTITSRASEQSSVNIPWIATDWRRNAPYTNVMLYFPYVGVINIPTSEIIGASTLDLGTYVTTTGSVILYISVGGKTIYRIGGNCGTNLLVGASNVNPLSAVSAIAGGIGGASALMMASSPLGATAVGASAIVGMLNGVQSIPSSVGTTSGGAFTSGYIPSCYVIYHDTNVNPASVSNVIGTPTMENKLLGTLTGFVQCSNASVSANAEIGIIDTINNKLNSGIFIE